MFRDSFFSQNTRFVSGRFAFLQFSCPCQKQPCTKITFRCRGKTKSGRPGRFSLCSRKRYPRPCATCLTRSSGFVPTAGTRAMTLLRFSWLYMSVIAGTQGQGLRPVGSREAAERRVTRLVRAAHRGGFLWIRIVEDILDRSEIRTGGHHFSRPVHRSASHEWKLSPSPAFGNGLDDSRRRERGYPRMIVREKIKVTHEPMEQPPSSLGCHSSLRVAQCDRNAIGAVFFFIYQHVSSSTLHSGHLLKEVIVPRKGTAFPRSGRQLLGIRVGSVIGGRPEEFWLRGHDLGAGGWRLWVSGPSGPRRRWPVGSAGCSGSGAGFLGGAGGVQFQEAGEDFVADGVGPAVAPGLLAVA